MLALSGPSAVPASAKVNGMNLDYSGPTDTPTASIANSADRAQGKVY